MNPGALASENETVPALDFTVLDAAPLRHAAVPTLVFELQLRCAPERQIRSVQLDVQVQIAARRRPYAEDEQPDLLELFGTPERWGTTLRTLPWLRATVVVPPFTGETVVALHVPCTYDLEVTASRYLHALRDREVPLEFLFSGAVFYAGAQGQLQTVRIGWDREASYSLPARVWRDTMDAHFPHSAWLRLDRDSFDRLARYKSVHSLTSWEQTLDALLDGREPG
jgi:uncharacterized protein DUF6084